MVKRREGKEFVKHSPNTTILPLVQRETTFLVKLTTPFISSIKQIKKILKKFDKSKLNHKKYNNGEYKKVQFITVKGMGKAIEKTVSIGMHFQELGYRVDVFTRSVEVLDEFKGSDDESEYEKRMVSCFEGRIYKERQA